MKIPGSVELYAKGVKMKADPTTSTEAWGVFFDQLKAANARWAFRLKRHQSVEVITNEETDSDPAVR